MKRGGPLRRTKLRRSAGRRKPRKALKRTRLVYRPDPKRRAWWREQCRLVAERDTDPRTGRRRCSCPHHGEQGCWREATDTTHVVGLGMGADRTDPADWRNGLANLESKCRKCHAAETNGCDCDGLFVL